MPSTQRFHNETQAFLNATMQRQNMALVVPRFQVKHESDQFCINVPLPNDGSQTVHFHVPQSNMAWWPDGCGAEAQIASRCTHGNLTCRAAWVHCSWRSLAPALAALPSSSSPAWSCTASCTPVSTSCTCNKHMLMRLCTSHTCPEKDSLTLREVTAHFMTASDSFV